MKVAPSDKLSPDDQHTQKATSFRLPGALISKSLPISSDNYNKHGIKSFTEIDEVEMKSRLKETQELYKEGSFKYKIASAFDLISNKISPDSNLPFTVIRKLEGKDVYGEISGANGTIAFAGRSFRTGENILILYNMNKEKSFEAGELLLQGNGTNILGSAQEVTVGMKLYKMSFIAPVIINYDNNTQDCFSQVNKNDTKLGTLEILQEKVKHGDLQVKTIYFSSAVEFKKEKDIYYNGRHLGIAQNIVLFSDIQKSASPWECPNAYFNDVSIRLALIVIGISLLIYLILKGYCLRLFLWYV
eukprot:g1195.t1